MVVLAALGAACLYAVASVLQQQAAFSEPDRRSMRPSLLLHLLRRPRWIAGVAADLTAYALEVVALARGSLVLVAPLLATGLLFALPLGAIFEGRRMQRREWLGAVELTLGLSVFLVVASPAAGDKETSTIGWLVLLAAALVPAGALIAMAGPPGRRRARSLAAATGVLYGLTAALTKTTSYLAENGVGSALAHWEPYALLTIGLTSFLVAQSAFQAGPLTASLPVLAVVHPLATIAVGALAFEEGVRTRGGTPVVEALALAAMVGGIVTLARAQAAAEERERPPPGVSPGRQDGALQD